MEEVVIRMGSPFWGDDSVLEPDRGGGGTIYRLKHLSLCERHVNNKGMLEENMHANKRYCRFIKKKKTLQVGRLRSSNKHRVLEEDVKT